MTFPGVPLGDQFSHPTLQGDASMHAAVDVRLNQLRTAGLNVGVGLTTFRAAQRAAAGLISGVAIFFDTLIESTGSGSYNSSNGVFTIGNSGLYLIQFQLRQATAIAFTAALGGAPAIYSTNLLRSAVCQAAAGHGPTIPAVPIWCLGGEQLTVVPTFGGSVTLPAAATNDAHWFSIAQVA